LTLYFDTSLLVAFLTREPRTEEIEHWLAAQIPGVGATSNWVVSEFSAALSAKVRAKVLQPSERSDSLAAFSRLRRDSLTLFPITEEHFVQAARLADRDIVGLRAGDALHAAIAAANHSTLCTLDRGMAKACIALGIPAIMV
jgi:predicted nucleic acid-binding protein